MEFNIFFKLAVSLLGITVLFQGLRETYDRWGRFKSVDPGDMILLAVIFLGLVGVWYT